MGKLKLIRMPGMLTTTPWRSTSRLPSTHSTLRLTAISRRTLSSRTTYCSSRIHLKTARRVCCCSSYQWTSTKRCLTCAIVMPDTRDEIGPTPYWESGSGGQRWGRKWWTTYWIATSARCLRGKTRNLHSAILHRWSQWISTCWDWRPPWTPKCTLLWWKSSSSRITSHTTCRPTKSMTREQ